MCLELHAKLNSICYYRNKERILGTILSHIWNKECLMIDLNGMSVFVAVAEAGSLSGAGRTLHLPKSTITRRLQTYEKAIGTTLFRRSTRSISLTDAGKKHFERVQTLVHEAFEAVEELAEHSDNPTGLIRISASLGVGSHLLAPLVWEFMTNHPQVRIEMLLTDRIIDLVAEGVDFAIRMGDLEDSELRTKLLGKARRVIVASPQFLDRHAVPGKPGDLRGLPAVVTSSDQSGWRFENGEIVRVNWRISAGTNRSATEACLLGFGVAILPLGPTKQHLESGELVILLEDYPLPEVAVNLVYPDVKHRSAAARAFHAALSQFKMG
jgi:DNA-binding transcriptional LysR family regulator